MGLKNTNYKIGNNTYNTVYAVFNGNIKKLGNDHVVYFNIDTTREFALSNQPLKVVEVRVKDWDRKTDLVAYAYKKGKEKISFETYDENGNKIIKEMDNVFTGWEDHKV